MNSTRVMQSKVSSKGWVVIPAALRRRYRLEPGTVVEFHEEGQKIVIIPWNPWFRFSGYETDANTK